MVTLAISCFLGVAWQHLITDKGGIRMSSNSRFHDDYWHYVNTHPGCSPDEARYYANAQENRRWGMTSERYEGSHPHAYRYDRYIHRGDQL